MIRTLINWEEPPARLCMFLLWPTGKDLESHGRPGFPLGGPQWPIWLEDKQTKEWIQLGLGWVFGTWICLPKWNLRFFTALRVGQGFRWHIQIKLTTFDYSLFRSHQIKFLVGWKHMLASQNVLFTCPIANFRWLKLLIPEDSWWTEGSGLIDTWYLSNGSYTLR